MSNQPSNTPPSFSNIHKSTVAILIVGILLATVLILEAILDVTHTPMDTTLLDTQRTLLAAFIILTGAKVASREITNGG